MSVCPACNGTGPQGAVLGVVCPRCGGSGVVSDAAAQAKTEGGETMSNKLTVNMVGLPAVEELFRALRAERDAALAKVAYLESALESAENDTHKAQHAFHELDGKWESVPWQAFRIWAGHVDATTVEDIEEATNTIEAWVCAHAPQPEETA